jgi:non-lysosomal glucosylceramidase
MNKKIENENSCCTGTNACTPDSTSRRTFIKASGLTALMVAASARNVMAGPFFKTDFNNEYNDIIPANKKLSKEWIASLYERGKPMSATGKHLKYIGMPINGICTGQVYLGGDGKLWRWNITGQRNIPKENPKGRRYLDPDIANSPIEQGFALEIGDQTYTLDKEGFEQVEFTNQYPMAKVAYQDKNCPLSVVLKAYTPFIPLNRDDSSYPFITMEYTLTNDSEHTQESTIAGWIPNISAENYPKYTFDKNPRPNKTFTYNQLEKLSSVECAATIDSKIQPELGAMALALLSEKAPSLVNLDVVKSFQVFTKNTNPYQHGDKVQNKHNSEKLACLGQKISLQPGESKTVSFALSWHVPITNYDKAFGAKKENKLFLTNHYSTLANSATDVARKIADRKNELSQTTQSWTDTWYDSSLPYWFLERTIVTVNCIQTEMGQRVAATEKLPEHYNFFEGVRCCPGNCTHVFHYAQGLSRLFPTIERECRDKIEYGLGFDQQTGVMQHRHSDSKFGDAIDGNCGTILRVYRESQMTTDYTFLASIWQRTKLSMEHVIEKWDGDEDGMLKGAQHNTLDEPWFGQVHWLINLYHAALKVSAIMATKMGEHKLAKRYQQIAAKGSSAMVDLLWRDEFGYFIHKPGPGELEKHGSTNGCHIDQVLGDSWLWNVGVEGVLPKDKVRQSLESLWKYNFSPNVGAFREKITEGRWYAGPGDAGLVMSSFPFGKVEPKSGKKSYAGYLNECMTGFEWQVSAHMIWEGMVEKGLAIAKAINDRYQPELRNPYNEIECSDHYSRAMASYGAYLAMCGYQYDGPEGKLGFAPRLQPDNFKAAFTTAEGWGSFSQKLENDKQLASLSLRYGKLSLNEFAVDNLKRADIIEVKVDIDGKKVATKLYKDKNRLLLKFPDKIKLLAGQQLNIIYS